MAVTLTETTTKEAKTTITTTSVLSEELQSQQPLQPRRR